MAPEGYYVIDSINEAENRTFCCPYQGCDGLTFGSASECLLHQENWHSGPYECRDCNARFAAVPALERHLRASQHRRRWYLDHELEIVDVRCRTPDEPQSKRHPSSSPSRTSASEPWTDAVFMITEEEFLSNAQDPINNVPTEKEPAFEDFVCREECCRRFGDDFKCISEYARHAVTVGHIFARAVKVKLESHDASELVLEGEMEAMRDYRCNAPKCKDFGRTWHYAQGYLTHLDSKPHRQAQVFDLGSVSDMISENSVAVDENLQCDQEGCLKYGMAFANKWNWRQHLVSVAHLQAKTNGSCRPTKLAMSTPLSQRRHHIISPIRVEIDSLPTPLTPSSPSFGRGRQHPKKTPQRAQRSRQQTPISDSTERRLAALEKENKELRLRLDYLEEELRNMYVASQGGSDFEEDNE